MSISPKSGVGSEGISHLSFGVGGGGISTTGETPGADFTGTPLSGSAPLEVTFTDTSTNAPTSWLWEKNDGGGWENFAGDPTDQNPVEELEEGTWSIKLTATNATGANTKTRTDYVVVEAAPSYTGPLDLVPGAIAAWSMQAMTAGSTANAIRLRRVSDDAEQTFALANNTVDEAAIAAFIGGSSAATDTWINQVGGGVDLTNDTAASEPAWNATGLGSAPTLTIIESDGMGSDAKYLYSLPAMDFSQVACTTVIVGKLTVSAADVVFWQAWDSGFGLPKVNVAITPGSLLTWFIEDTDAENIAGGESENVSAALLNIPVVIELAWDIGNVRLRINGVSKTADSSQDVGTPPGGTLEDVPFVLGTFANTGHSWVLNVAEVLVYPSMLSDANGLLLTNNAMTRYGIT